MTEYKLNIGGEAGPNPYGKICDLAYRVNSKPIDPNNPSGPTIRIQGRNGHWYDAWDVIEKTMDFIEQNIGQKAKPAAIEWLPINTAPSYTKLIVADEWFWAVGILEHRSYWRWYQPPKAPKWNWFNHDSRKPLDFEPTHWIRRPFNLPQRPAMQAHAIADEMAKLCYAETEAKFFDFVTDNAESIIRLLRSINR